MAGTDAALAAGGAKGGGATDGVQALGGHGSADLVAQLRELIAKLSAALDSLKPGTDVAGANGGPGQTGVAGANGGPGQAPAQHPIDGCHKMGGPPASSSETAPHGGQTTPATDSGVAGANGGPDKGKEIGQVGGETGKAPGQVGGVSGDPAKDKVAQDAISLGGAPGSAVAGVAQLDTNNKDLLDTLRGLIDTLTKLIDSLNSPEQKGGPGGPVPAAGGDTPPTDGASPASQSPPANSNGTPPASNGTPPGNGGAQSTQGTPPPATPAANAGGPPMPPTVA